MRFVVPAGARSGNLTLSQDGIVSSQFAYDMKATLSVAIAGTIPASVATYKAKVERDQNRDGTYETTLFTTAAIAAGSMPMALAVPQDGIYRVTLDGYPASNAPAANGGSIVTATAVDTIDAGETIGSVAPSLSPRYLPTITSLSPTSGSAGTTVTLGGSNFAPAWRASGPTVTFAGASGGVAATITSISDSELIVTVPTGAVTGDIVATQDGVPSVAGGAFSTGISVMTLAGLSGTPGSADGTGTGARFSSPAGVTVDATGTVYVADSGNHTIRKISPAGVVETVAGLAGSSGNLDGTGSAARFNNPSALAVDATGSLYVADTSNGKIRKITPGGAVTTLASGFSLPYSIAVDATGTVYVANSNACRISKITPGGVVTTLAGSGACDWADGTGTAAKFKWPYGIAVDATGDVYVADSYNGVIRKITPEGVVTTIAGQPGAAGNVDGTGAAARFGIVYGLAVDAAGNLYVGDESNSSIRKVTPGRVVTTMTNLAGRPASVAVDASGSVYVAARDSHVIRKVF